MTTIKTRAGGKVFVGANAKAVVFAMMKGDFLVRTKTDYMTEVAERLRVIFGVNIKFKRGDHLSFLKALAKHKFIILEI